MNAKGVLIVVLIVSLLAMPAAQAFKAVGLPSISATTITITGTGFGPQPEYIGTDVGVFVIHAGSTYQAQVLSWSNTQIVASNQLTKTIKAAKDDLVIVKTISQTQIAVPISVGDD